MGKSHALSGALGWLSACAGAHAAAGAGWPVPDPSPQAVAVGAVVTAGYALLPDIDHPESTIARALGPITGALAWLANRGAAAMRTAGCAHCASGPDRGGHRAVTHTFAFAAVLGLVLAVLAAWLGPGAGLAVAGVGVWLASYPALSPRTRANLLPRGVRRLNHRFAATLGSLLVTALAVLFIREVMVGRSWWWIGVAAGAGTLIHSLGDAMTRSGSPLWWPVRIRGCRWQSVGTPRWIRFTTGKVGEKVVVGLMLLAVSVSVYVLVATGRPTTDVLQLPSGALQNPYNAGVIRAL